MSADDGKFQALRDEITRLKAIAKENEIYEEKIIQDLQLKIEQEIQLSMDVDQTKSETRILKRNVSSLQESVSEHRAMIHAASHDNENNKIADNQTKDEIEAEMEAELNLEVERHQTLLIARENAVDALAAVSEALQFSDKQEDDPANSSLDVDAILSMMQKASMKEDDKDKKDGDKEGDSDSDDSEVNLDEVSLNPAILAESNDKNDDKNESKEEHIETSPNISPIDGDRSMSNDDDEGRSISRDGDSVISRDGDSFSNFMLTSSQTHGNGLNSLDEQGRDAKEIEKMVKKLKQSAYTVASRTATARGTLARLVRLIKIYIELLPETKNEDQEESKEALLKLVKDIENRGGYDNESSWMEYHMNKHIQDQTEKSITDSSEMDSGVDSDPLWLDKLLKWYESYQINTSSSSSSSSILDNAITTSSSQITNDGDNDGNNKKKRKKNKKERQEAKLNRPFYVGVELTDSDAFINAQIKALVTLARRSGCFSSIVGSRYMQEGIKDGEDEGETEVDDKERQLNILKQKLMKSEEDDIDDELNIGGVLIVHAYEWQSWGLFNKGGRWSGLREDLPSPLSSLLPPQTSTNLETTIQPTSSSSLGTSGRNRSSSSASDGGGGVVHRRRSSNTFFALRGLGELYTDINADTAVSFNANFTSNHDLNNKVNIGGHHHDHDNSSDDASPVGSLGMNWKWLGVWQIDSFTTPESLMKSKETKSDIKLKKDIETAETLNKMKKENDELELEHHSKKGNKPKSKYNFQSSSSIDDEEDEILENIKKQELEELEEEISSPLSYLTDEDGWQYAIESKDGVNQLCAFEGLTTCGIDDGIVSGRPARQLRRRRWSRLCQLSGLKTSSTHQNNTSTFDSTSSSGAYDKDISSSSTRITDSISNPWPDLFKCLVSNKKHWMNNDGQDIYDDDEEEENEDGDDKDGEDDEENGKKQGDDDEIAIPTLPKSLLSEWSRILKLQHELARNKLKVNQYKHMLNIAQSLELEFDVEEINNNRILSNLQEMNKNKIKLDKNVKKLLTLIERAKHDARNDQKLRDALLVPQTEE